VKINKDDVALSILPLHHTFENTCGFLTIICNGACVAFCDGLRYISGNMVEYKVSVMVGVPLLFENMYGKLTEQVKKQGLEKKFKLGVKLGNILAALLGNNARRRIMHSVLDKLGGRLRLIVSGAAAIDPLISKGFEEIGVRLVQGYGLTETSPVVAGCNDFILDHGTCGQPLPDVELAVDTDDKNGIGEIMVRGPIVMLGYHENPEATAEVLSPDGWFRTGDLGTITEKGYIKITGRVKSMIVLKSGKKVFPEEVEMLINKLGFVKESMVWGEPDPTGEVDICARLVLDKDIVNDTLGGEIDESGLKGVLDQAIKSVNSRMPTFKTVLYYMYCFEDLTKTTTLKVKRYIEVERLRKILKDTSVSIKNIAGRNIDALLLKLPGHYHRNSKT
jgi:long-chain acyl-CoA synthetase